MASPITVPYTIFAEEPISESNPREGPTAVVKYKCAWTDRWTLINNLGGTTIGVPGGIIRTAPHRYPDLPFLYAWVVEDIRGIGGPKTVTVDNETWMAYDQAIISVRYQVPEFAVDAGVNDDPSGVPWTTTVLDVGGEFFTVPDTCFKFLGGRATNTPIGIFDPQIQLSFRRHWLPFLPVAEMAALTGKVNAAAFAVVGYVFAAETLLFLGGPNQSVADTQGNRAQEVEYRMSWKPNGWNKYYSPEPGAGWVTVTSDGTAGGTKPYQTGDFTTLP